MAIWNPDSNEDCFGCETHGILRGCSSCHLCERQRTNSRWCVPHSNLGKRPGSKQTVDRKSTMSKGVEESGSCLDKRPNLVHCDLCGSISLMCASWGEESTRMKTRTRMTSNDRTGLGSRKRGDSVGRGGSWLVLSAGFANRRGFLYAVLRRSRGDTSLLGLKWTARLPIHYKSRSPAWDEVFAIEKTRTGDCFGLGRSWSVLRELRKSAQRNV